MSTVSIGLVDDHPLMIEGIVTLLSRAQGFEVTSTGSTARDIIDISSRLHPDVIIVDLSMAGDVYEAIATSIRVSPDTKIVAFTAATGVDSAIRALDAGANGYVLKGSSAQELIQAVESVRHGETYITQSFASQVIAALRNASLRRVAAEAVRFSIREDQIVRLLVARKDQQGNRHRAKDQREDRQKLHDNLDAETPRSKSPRSCHCCTGAHRTRTGRFRQKFTLAAASTLLSP